jgi:3-dehydroquinate dehydratase-1
MTARGSVKARTAFALVGVIASPRTFRTALSLAEPPDFFELRLDALYPVLPEVERSLGELRRPLILTARHPLEGGMNNLSPAQRCSLLLHFLSRAAYVDVELRSADELRPVLHAAEERDVKRIISVHEMDRALPAAQLQRLLDLAEAQNADVFKIVMRTETPDEIERLLTFFAKNKKRMPISAMGVGDRGREARIALARAGSVLNYVHLAMAKVPGQLSLAEMRSELRRS